MKKLTFFLSLLAFLWGPSVFADVTCYNSCESGGYPKFFLDGTVCGEGAADDFPFASSPSCFNVAIPTCSVETPWMCRSDEACSALPGHIRLQGNCISVEGLPVVPDYPSELEALNEIAGRTFLLYGLTDNFFTLASFYFSVITGLLFLFFILFVFIVFIKKLK